MKWILLLLVTVATSLQSAPIAQLTMRFDGPQFLVTPVCEAGQKYYFKVTGTYRIIDQDHDAAYRYGIYGGPRIHTDPNYMWFWNDVATNVPFASGYQENHTYYYYFEGKGTPEFLTFLGNAGFYSSSSGQLTFELYPFSQRGDEVLTMTKTNLVMENLILGCSYDVEWTRTVTTNWQRLLTFTASSHAMGMNMGTAYGTTFFRLKKNVP